MIALSLGSALVAGTVVALGDALVTLGGASGDGPGAGGFVIIALALYLAFALIWGAGAGVVLGAIQATHPGAGVGAALRRLRDDAELDTTIAAAVVAGAACLGVLAGGVAVLALKLVAGVERKTIGALLAGGMTAAIVPVLAVLAYPVFRAARKVVGIAPRLGILSRTVLVVVGGLAAGALAVMVVVGRGLDWRVLPLGGPIALGLLVALQVLLMILWTGPLGGVRARVPARGMITGAAAVLAAGLALAGVTVISPTPRATALLNVDSRGAKLLAQVARKLADRDHDGAASILGGGDCDDGDPEVYPGAHDEPGDGIDQNCVGGDAEPEADDGAKVTETDTTRAFKHEGNILLIGVDTLRADRLYTYTRRGGRSLTPRMDALAKGGVAFSHAYAQAPHTPRSFPSIFFSRFPSQVVWDKPNANYPVAQPENVSLFEVLSDAGVATFGESSHFYFVAEKGITQGVEHWDNDGATDLKGSNHDIAAPRIVAKTTAKLHELAGKKQRFAMFVHLFEPHSTYMEHPDYPITARGTDGLEEKYDYEVAMVDRAVGELVDALAKEGLAESTMIVLFSDHGESFGSHRAGGQKVFFHGTTVYDEVLHVPLVIAGPGLKPGVVDGPVMMLDLAPTIADLFKVKAADVWKGRSLLPALLGEPLPPAEAAGELLPYPNWDKGAKAWIAPDGKTKVIYRVQENVWELYDLTSDPGEQKNLFRDGDPRSDEGKAALTKWMERAGAT